MKTKLDERQELIKKIKLLSVTDIQKVNVFISGMEAGKILMEAFKCTTEGVEHIGK